MLGQKMKSELQPQDWILGQIRATPDGRHSLADLNERIFALLRGWSYPLFGSSLSDYREEGSPAYAEDLSDAIKLLPVDYPGLKWKLENDGKVPGNFIMSIWIKDGDLPISLIHRVDAATPALAVAGCCIMAAPDLKKLELARLDDLDLTSGRRF
jgi:hypothetical protein